MKKKIAKPVIADLKVFFDKNNQEVKADFERDMKETYDIPPYTDIDFYANQIHNLYGEEGYYVDDNEEGLTWDECIQLAEELSK